MNAKLAEHIKRCATCRLIRRSHTLTMRDKQDLHERCAGVISQAELSRRFGIEPREEVL